MGVIECETEQAMKAKESEVQKIFEKDNDFRDMFFLSQDMIDFIVSHTIPLKFTWNRRKLSRTVDRDERKRKYQREWQRDRMALPENREKRNRYQKEWRQRNLEKCRERDRAYWQKKKRERNHNPSQLTLFEGEHR